MGENGFLFSKGMELPNYESAVVDRETLPNARVNWPQLPQEEIQDLGANF